MCCHIDDLRGMSSPYATKPTPTHSPPTTPTPTATLNSGMTSGDTTFFDPSRGAFIDEHALGTPNSVESSITSLSGYLITPTRNDGEKARVIYRWITNNISYDVQGYVSKTYGDQSAVAVLKRRTAVCAGYANLFEALGSDMDLTVEVIGGWAKGYGFATGDLMEDVNHAWTGVEVDGSWYLVDSTWGAGSIGPDQRFVREFNDYYFLVAPKRLIYTHFPEEPAWQLLEDPLSENQFVSLPRVWPRYFENGLIRTGNRLDLTVSAPSDVLLMAGVAHGDKELPESTTFVRRKGSDYQVSTIFPAPGKYTLTIYTKRADEEGMYQSTVSYTVVASESEGGHLGFPIVWQPFFDNDLGFVSHERGSIETLGEVTILVSAPEDVLLMADLKRGDDRLAENLVFAQRKGHDYEIFIICPTAGEYALTLYTKRTGDEGMYRNTLEYTIISTEGLPSHPGFPETFEAFHERGAYLYKPITGHLAPGSIEGFRLKAPGAEKVAVIIGDRWQYLQLRDGMFQGEIAVAEGEVGLYAQYPGQVQYEGLARYWSP